MATKDVAIIHTISWRYPNRRNHINNISTLFNKLLVKKALLYLSFKYLTTNNTVILFRLFCDEVRKAPNKHDKNVVE